MEIYIHMIGQHRGNKITKRELRDLALNKNLIQVGKKDTSKLICESGTNSPALRPEFKDLYLQGERQATSQAEKTSEEE
jgi:hypothetical protein